MRTKGDVSSAEGGADEWKALLGSSELELFAAVRHEKWAMGGPGGVTCVHVERTYCGRLCGEGRIRSESGSARLLTVLSSLRRTRLGRPITLSPYGFPRESQQEQLR